MNDSKFKRGSKHYKSVLTESDIPKIRALLGTRSYQQIANRFGVGRQAIYMIAKGINWAHV
ncbi:putative DNA-binding protein YlxM (UPF0122 family) [Dyadobacter sp. BE34]|uniref:DNA-binding protein YlxM (UPF0122 family) n=1 Tax=Dyadobacter fermentans TaxID=94254 RepID=A0ABU1QWS5_9BACT|nr:putative DNA-binding protein YlxM (UPF0122 family) [Dyadobacter fermentans]MDR7042687.1 putative DNA-binding protein YlxM (UPF0122 family) [Dyadobacter sp. BE242]MDR7196999.1 putative DNA-binding protein YlxM (UPF0122 family) [Dyadobacter sp. BE34]MDR7215566.1 putative DNA-binding protein YlxM (UPF0122 family) [Dyadobacter sp. BE31]MDR7263102.1 putative DNA-binding protein YlxM (UPF0122 family) [Dyadobacter sp. BE32]